MKQLGLLVAALALLAAACGVRSSDEDGVSSSDDAGVSIIVTTTPLGDLVKNVVGDAASVEVLMPIGQNPHAFQPSAKQVALIQEADLVVANGLGLEVGLHDVLEAAEADGVKVWEVGPDIDPREFVEATDADAGHEDHDEEGHDHGSLDPHFWLDPLKDADAARQLAVHLSEIAPNHDWSEGAEAYVTELEAVHGESEELLSVVPAEQRRLVTSHRAFGYFSDRYDFEMIATVIPGGSELSNPSSAELAALVETIELEQVPAIFTETIEPDALSQAIAAEVGYEVVVVELYTGSLGEPGSDGDTLLGMLRTNAQRIADALS